MPYLKNWVWAKDQNICTFANQSNGSFIRNNDTKIENEKIFLMRKDGSSKEIFN
jgi:hypothetical protein